MLTPELAEVIVAAVRRGNYLDSAAAIAGVRRSTLHDWLRRGAHDEEGLYADFSDAIRQAMALSEDEDLQMLSKHRKSTWLACAWRLERKFPDRWGRRDRRSVSDPDGVALGDDAMADALAQVREAILSGDDVATREGIALAISHGIALALERLPLLTPGQLPTAIGALAKLEKLRGGRKIRFPNIIVNMGAPAEPEPAPEPAATGIAVPGPPPGEPGPGAS